MKNWRISIIGVSLLISVISFGQQRSLNTVSGNTIAFEQLEERISVLMDSLNMPGISIAIINDNQIVYHNKLGVTNSDTAQEVSSQSIFEAASLSKPVFAYFMMRMVQEGKLDLDEPIYEALAKIFPEGLMDPQTLEQYKTITARMVLSHSTGLPNWLEGKPLKLAFKPGNGFSYSGEAYQHLAASFGTQLGIGWGKELDDLFIREMAHPLGMEHSAFTWNEHFEKFKVNGHKNGKVNTAVHRDKKVGPGYSLKSDAYEYALFLIEMMEPKLLSVELRDEMLKTHNVFDPDNKLAQETGQTGWGLGFAQKPTPNGLMHLHTGNNHDFQAYAMFVPEQQYGFVVFTNSDKLFEFIQGLEKLIEKQI